VAEAIEVRATITLPGLGVGKIAYVDPSDRYIADAIKAGHLVPTSGPAANGAGEPDIDRSPDIPADTTSEPDEVEGADAAVVDDE
jgi:hypothetical protein